MFSFSLAISFRKMELSLQTLTLKVRLKFYIDCFKRNPASQGVYHSYCFLEGKSCWERRVSVCREKGISLLSQNRGAIV